MGAPLQRNVPYRRSLTELAFSAWVLIPLATIVGLFVAFQFFHLTPRYIKLVFAILFGIAVLRLPLPSTLALFLVIFPAPTFIFLGDTNVIFIAILAVVWIVRLRLGSAPATVDTPVTWAIGLYFLAHLVSFLNISDPFVLKNAIENMTFLFFAAVLYFLIVNNIRTEQQIGRMLKALCVTALFVDITAIAEYYFGYRLVPLWFIYGGALGSRFEEGGRAGGVFGFHGLLADFSAMNFWVQFVLGMRARSRAAKVFYFGLAALSLLMIANSANRGGAVLWGIGALGFLWYHRDRIHWPRFLFASLTILAVVGFFGLLSDRGVYRVRVLSRLAQTQFIRGIPENRVDLWNLYLARIPEHLWIGHGPFIDLRKGMSAWSLSWPHNAYLFYLYTTGVFGLAAFLWILGKLIVVNRPRGRVDLQNGPISSVAQVLFYVQTIQFALSQLRDEHQRGNVYVYYMWIVFALATVGARLARERSESVRPPDLAWVPGSVRGPPLITPLQVRGPARLPTPSTEARTPAGGGQAPPGAPG